jgi:Zn-dependent protease/predicted transcriptional regulator
LVNNLLSYGRDEGKETMEAQIKLGRIFGVQLGLHYSWLLIALLITLSLAGHFSATNAHWGSVSIWILAIATSLLFFASIVVHELSHAAVAKARGLPVRSITLFALGGVAQIEKESADPKTEFWMGIVGPITSAVIGVVCLALAWALGWSAGATPGTPLLAMAVWLGYINITLAAFNMIPGFPLDGGRVLRAIIWWNTKDPSRATRIAARVGQLIAFGFIMSGFFRFFTGAGLGGLWLAFIGWFLLVAARESQTRVRVAEDLRGIRVGDIMTRECPTVDRHFNLQSFADDYLLRTGRSCFFVVENGHIAGRVTPQEVKEVARNRWPYTTVGDIMRPLDKLHAVDPGTPVADALESMGRDDINQLPVVSDHRLEGVISRSQVLRLLQARAELNM